ncbi:putative homoserine O-acetyltransferase [Trichodelitschia bisporula]|uniref:Putative homoserine O-acetyltransferase n=1 Tax=Trichodelitschia bisporula TaxID=703511 RepID=A0A6G1HXR7_9PEZI|nr:putative homoserine O-acetyltransferase [Trichodelitschia bisporula]
MALTEENKASAPPSNPAAPQKYQRVTSQPENPFAALIPSQSIAIIPSFTLESGVELHNVPVAYKTFGTLSPAADNAMVICHALTGSADVADWWGPLLGGPGKSFDTSRFFVVCINSLGSPYGSASPVTYMDGDASKGLYGPDFPLTTVRDDVHIFKLLLDDLGVRSIAAVIGGSMGGMLVLEFAYFGPSYVRAIVPIATSARYSAWGISWGEAQRQSIYSDPKYADGYYPHHDPPATGLGAARMAALLTYRSRDSFESRFGRNTPDPARVKGINDGARRSALRAATVDDHWAVHNDGNRNAGSSRARPALPTPPPSAAGPVGGKAPTYFSAQSYLRYQGEKFIARFDANCYIAITRKLDTHDVSRGRALPETGHYPTAQEQLSAALGLIEQPCLILGIQSDGLFTFAEQEELAAAIPGAVLETIDSSEGHDAFLLEFEQVNRHLVRFLERVLPDIMQREPVGAVVEDEAGMVAMKTSTFGEAEVDDITAW